MTAARTARFAGTILLACVLSAGALFTFHRFGAMTGDSPRYLKLAENLAAGHGFSAANSAPFDPEVFRPPGYPLFLAMLLRLGLTLGGIAAVQVAAYALALCLVGRLVYLSWGEPALWCFGLFGVTYLPVVRWATSITTESVVALLVALLACSWSSLMRSTDSWAVFPTAAVLAVLVLTRSEYVLLAPLLVLLPVCRPDPTVVRRAAGFAVLFSLLVIPWMVRNYRVTAEPSATLGVGSGMVLWVYGLELELGSSASVDKAQYWLDRDFEALHSGTDPVAAAAADQRLRSRGLALLRKNATKYPGAVAYRLLYRQWVEMSDPRLSRRDSILVATWASCVLLLAVMGALTLSLAQRPFLPGVLIVCAMGTLHPFLGGTEARYMAPVKPLVFGLAAGFVVSSSRALKRKEWGLRRLAASPAASVPSSEWPDTRCAASAAPEDELDLGQTAVGKSRLIHRGAEGDEDAVHQPGQHRSPEPPVDEPPCR